MLSSLVCRLGGIAMIDNVQEEAVEEVTENADEAPVEALVEASAEASADTSASLPPSVETEAPPVETERPRRPRRVHVPIEDKATIANDVALRALTLIGVEVKEIVAKVDDEQVGLKIGPITSPEGATLDGRAWESLQFLLNKAINRHAIKRTRLNMEADGFRARHSDGLDKMAASIARKVQKSGQAIAIGPVEPGELRQLASQFNRVTGVSVQTTGDPDRKLVVISPGGGRGRRRRGG